MSAGWLQKYCNTIRQTPNTLDNRYVIRYNLKIFTRIVSLGWKNNILTEYKSVKGKTPALLFEKICVQTKLSMWLCNVNMSHNYLSLFRAITRNRIVALFAIARKPLLLNYDQTRDEMIKIFSYEL